MTETTLFKIEAVLIALMGIPAALAVGQVAVAFGVSTIWAWAVLIAFWGATFAWWHNKFQKDAAPFMVALFFAGLTGLCLVGFAWVAGAIFLFTFMAGITAGKRILT